MTNEEFLKKAQSVHKGKFIYEKTNVDKRDEKGRVIITCHIHGDFLQQVNSHLQGQGCPLCSHRSKKYTVDEIKNKITEKYGDKYDVSLIKEYKSNVQKLPLICKEHGYFEANWNDLSHNHGCQICGRIRNYDSLRKTTEQFCKESKKIHGDKYDLSSVKYVNAFTHITLKCNTCGNIFEITPHDHLKGRGCPNCNESHLENEVRVMLKQHNIKYIDRCNKKTFEWLNRQHLDFYLPEFNVCIECQGLQHFESIKFFGGDEKLKIREKRDENKKKLCEEHGIKILYFTHENYQTFLGEKIIKNKDSLLNEILSNSKK